MAKPQSPRKKPPIRIPESDNEALIASNLLTLIGRVTNQRFQRPRAIVDFMPQIWNLEGRVEGRELSPELFQFKFESEKDLLSVLDNGPYHHKRWMILLQRWEPTISPTFPSTISFWIRIHGLPLHYWTDQTLYTIGKALGDASKRDVRGARVRVDINGLQPLDMKSEIELPSGEITEVEFEYMKIEKHCFNCFSLSHEEEDCPSRAIGDRPAKERKLGITQALALERIEAGKRRHDERRGYKPPSQRTLPAQELPRRDHHSSEYRGSMEFARRPPSNYSYQSEASRPPGGHNVPAHYRPRSRLDPSVNLSSNPSRSFTSHRQRTSRTPPKEDDRPSPRHSGNSQQRLYGSTSSHTPPPRTPRERMELSGGKPPPAESAKSRE